MAEWDVKGVLGSIHFDGAWVRITKKEIGKAPRPFRLRAADVTGTRLKPATTLFHGYVQFLVPGSDPAEESRSLFSGGRPPDSDPHSLSIPKKSSDDAAKLVAAVGQARA
ncbi:DUF4429 domain-containing protein [Streptomyces zhihengii]|uniref:DUF4429 domain-containing protein n=1 Tax=Streptomyces zhihengii TaxID=1818004 RepID=A0ABS2V3S8_9ACTN|nr:DUF4429 domain-containing protein [Streptomyces zhihengii]MBM9624114.1 DUF4429 domain-containing protein [Streptomyces zhihengii]